MENQKNKQLSKEEIVAQLKIKVTNSKKYHQQEILRSDNGLSHIKRTKYYDIVEVLFDSVILYIDYLSSLSENMHPRYDAHFWKFLYTNDELRKKVTKTYKSLYTVLSKNNERDIQRAATIIDDINYSIKIIHEAFWIDGRNFWILLDYK